MTNTGATDLELATSEVERTQDVMFKLSMRLGDNPSRKKLRKHEAAVDAYEWARMEYDREWDNVYKRCPSRFSASGIMRDLPKNTPEEHDHFWASLRARATDAASAAKKRKA